MSKAARIANLKLAIEALETAKEYALAAIDPDSDVGNQVALQIEELQADLEADIQELAS